MVMKLSDRFLSAKEMGVSSELFCNAIKKANSINVRNYKRAQRFGVQYEFLTYHIARMMLTTDRCYWCNEPLTLADMTIDHVIPMCRGGGHTQFNLVVSCLKCNQDKGSKTKMEWDLEAKEMVVKNCGGYAIVGPHTIPLKYKGDD